MTGHGIRRHCERSEAIQSLLRRLGCFVASLLAMTPKWIPACAGMNGEEDIDFHSLFAVEKACLEVV
ncbi:MAG: hypothetical protein WB760_34570 [Xanthobacteraceae bacterium]